jgi:hypothetical protein
MLKDSSRRLAQAQKHYRIQTPYITSDDGFDNKNVEFEQISG